MSATLHQEALAGVRTAAALVPQQVDRLACQLLAAAANGSSATYAELVQHAEGDPAFSEYSRHLEGIATRALELRESGEWGGVPEIRNAQPIPPPVAPLPGRETKKPPYKAKRWNRAQHSNRPIRERSVPDRPLKPKKVRMREFLEPLIRSNPGIRAEEAFLNIPTADRAGMNVLSFKSNYFRPLQKKIEEELAWQRVEDDGGHDEQPAHSPSGPERIDMPRSIPTEVLVHEPAPKVELPPETVRYSWSLLQGREARLELPPNTTRAERRALVLIIGEIFNLEDETELAPA